VATSATPVASEAAQEIFADVVVPEVAPAADVPTEVTLVEEAPNEEANVVLPVEEDVPDWLKSAPEAEEIPAPITLPSEDISAPAVDVPSAPAALDDNVPDWLKAFAIPASTPAPAVEEVAEAPVAPEVAPAKKAPVEKAKPSAPSAPKKQPKEEVAPASVKEKKPVAEPEAAPTPAEKKPKSYPAATEKKAASKKKPFDTEKKKPNLAGNDEDLPDWLK